MGCRDKKDSGQAGPDALDHVDATPVKFLQASNGKHVDVVLGAFDVELTSPRSNGMGFEWDVAVIGGAAVESRGKKIAEPSGDIDGGRFLHVYRFDAVAKGDAKITITAKNGDRLPPPFVLDVTVR